MVQEEVARRGQSRAAVVAGGAAASCGSAVRTAPPLCLPERRAPERDGRWSSWRRGGAWHTYSMRVMSFTSCILTLGAAAAAIARRGSAKRRRKEVGNGRGTVATSKQEGAYSLAKPGHQVSAAGDRPAPPAHASSRRVSRRSGGGRPRPIATDHQPLTSCRQRADQATAHARAVPGHVAAAGFARMTVRMECIRAQLLAKRRNLFWCINARTLPSWGTWKTRL